MRLLATRLDFLCVVNETRHIYQLKDILGGDGAFQQEPAHELVEVIFWPCPFPDEIGNDI